MTEESNELDISDEPEHDLVVTDESDQRSKPALCGFNHSAAFTRNNSHSGKFPHLRAKYRRHAKSNSHLRTSRTPVLLLLLLCSLFCQLQVGLVCASSAGMETLVAVVGQDFVMIGADTTSVQSIVLTSSDMDKIRVVSDPFPCAENSIGKKDTTKERGATKSPIVALAAAGDLADVNRLYETLHSHATIREYETSVGADVEVVDLYSSGRQGGIPLQSHSFNAPIGLSVSQVANLARNEISQKLRSNAPYRVGVLVAGMQRESILPRGTRRGAFGASVPLSAISRDVQEQLQRAIPSGERNTAVDLSKSSVGPQDEVSLRLVPCLFWLDEYGALQKIRYASHGMASSFLNAILDRNYHKNLTREEAAQLIQSCFKQLQTRYVVNSPKPPLIKCIDEYGCHVVPTAVASTSLLEDGQGRK